MPAPTMSVETESIGGTYHLGAVCPADGRELATAGRFGDAWRVPDLDQVPDEEAIPQALARYPGVVGASWAPLGTGLINRPSRVRTDAGAFVLQRVNPIFDRAIHDNIAAVTRLL